MTFLHRGRPVFGRIGRPSEPAPEPVAAATGLPVAAPVPEGVTDDLRPDTSLDELRTIALARASGLLVESVGCETFVDGTDADKAWVVGESLRLERLAVLTKQHGPWEAARRLWTPALKPSTTSSTHVKYQLDLRGMRGRWL